MGRREKFPIFEKKDWRRFGHDVPPDVANLKVAAVRLLEVGAAHQYVVAHCGTEPS